MSDDDKSKGMKQPGADVDVGNFTTVPAPLTIAEGARLADLRALQRPPTDDERAEMSALGAREHVPHPAPAAAESDGFRAHVHALLGDLILAIGHMSAVLPAASGLAGHVARMKARLDQLHELV